MNRITVAGCLIVLMALAPMASLRAQNLDALLEAVDKIEASLSQMVEKEAATRNKQIAELKSSIAGLDGSTPAGGATEEQLADVMAELVALRVEVQGLKRSLNKNAKQLASIDSDSWVSPGASENQVEEMSRKLDDLNHKVEGMTGGQPGHADPAYSKKTSGTSVHGKIYSHGMADVSGDDGSFSEFALSRTYVTLRSKLSDRAAVRVTSDMRTIDGKYNIILKYAYLDWKPAFSNGYAGLRFGLQPTLYIDYMNKFWGRRYLAKTVSDKKAFLTSSDLGIGIVVNYGPKADYGFLSLALLNGTSYTDVEEFNDHKDLNVVTVVKPFRNMASLSRSALMAQFYTGAQNHSFDALVSVDSSGAPWDTTTTEVTASDWKRQIFSMGGVFALMNTADFGFDLNWSTVGKGAEHDAVKKTGMSFFGAFYLKDLARQASFWKTLNFFWRLDLYDPDTAGEDDKQTTAMFGLESAPFKGLVASLNYRTTSFESDALSSSNKLWLNTQFKF